VVSRRRRSLVLGAELLLLAGVGAALVELACCNLVDPLLGGTHFEMAAQALRQTCAPGCSSFLLHDPAVVGDGDEEVDLQKDWHENCRALIFLQSLLHQHLGQERARCRKYHSEAV